MRKGCTAAVLAFSILFLRTEKPQAYMTSAPAAIENHVSTAELKITLTEPHWDETKAAHMLPGSTVEKDPIVTNISETDAWIFLEVHVPCREIAVVDETTRRKKERSRTELFSFAASEEWELVERRETESETVYVYGCRQIVKPGKKTAALFTSVRIVNYLEGELSAEETLQMQIIARAIQSSCCEKGSGLKEIYAKL